MRAARSRRLRLFGFVAVIAAVLVVTWPGRSASSTTGITAGNHLLLYCAAGIREPVQSVIADYAKAYGVTVDVQYGGSGTLLSNLEVARRGDLYLAADAKHMELATSRSLVHESIPLARQHLVLAVKRGNSLNLRSLADLIKPGVRVAYANPEVASAGKAIRAVLEKANLWEQANAQAAVFKPTVNDVINDVVLGSVDVGVVWDPLLINQPQLEAVTLPELSARREEIRIGVLDSSARPTQALHFARFMAARDRGLTTFSRMGYQAEPGDRWEDRPALTLYSGGVNRVAIQETLREFEQREGCTVRVNYNGCGILLAQMKALPDGDAFPDAYLACDVSFLDPIAERFHERRLLSQTEVIILVPKANPHAIKRLNDLAQPGLRVGLCNAEQSTLGALTQRMLSKLNLVAAIEPNVRSRTPTADLLVTQLDTGSLDAVVVYRANANAVLDRHTALGINLPEARAVQPYAVAKQAQHTQLANRLLAALDGVSSRKRYLAAGFTPPTP